jgi:hypothetical protein
LRQNFGAVGWNLTSNQIARLDAAGAIPLAYPYFHQRDFAERNRPRVAKGRFDLIGILFFSYAAVPAYANVPQTQ